jgi:hypothetical protein
MGLPLAVMVVLEAVEAQLALALEQLLELELRGRGRLVALVALLELAAVAVAVVVELALLDRLGCVGVVFIARGLETEGLVAKVLFLEL